MKAAIIGLAVVALLAGLSLANGCSMDEMIKVDVPPNTRQHFRDNLGAEVPAVVTLRDARLLRTEGDRKFRESIESQTADHIASNDAFDAEIADGTFIESIMGSLVNLGMETYLPGIGNMPGGAILSTLLAGLGLWFVPSPGTAKRLKKREDEGYDLGREEALDTIKETAKTNTTS